LRDKKFQKIYFALYITDFVRFSLVSLGKKKTNTFAIKKYLHVFVPEIYLRPNIYFTYFIFPSTSSIE